MSTKFYSRKGKSVLTPDDWQSLVTKGRWQLGRSAERLATAWLGSNGFPVKVAAALEQVPEFRGMTLERGVVEHTCPVPGEGPQSATDIMVQSRSLFPVTVSIAVEGKVDESFDATISSWLQKGKSVNSPKNRKMRVAGMCDRLGLPEAAVAPIRYQLLHRTYAAIVEAATHDCDIAMLLVHSFSPDTEVRPGWRDFEKWAAVLNSQADPIRPDVPWFAKKVVGVSVWLLWVSDIGGVRHAAKRR
jgi:hypothetical protein